MGIRVVAEGVETEEQFYILQQNGCEQAQGYLFSKPVSIQEYEERFITGLKKWTKFCIPSFVANHEWLPSKTLMLRKMLYKV